MPATITAPIDISEVDLVRRQGDISGTLLYVAPNGNPANIGNWTFTFSVQPGSSLLTSVWTPPIGNGSGAAMTTVGVGGFTVPPYNCTVASVPMVSTTGMNPGDYLSIAGAGILQIKTVTSSSLLLLYNPGFPGNPISGSILAGVNVYEASNVGYTVLVIPSTITDWNSAATLSPTRSAGKFQYYIKYDTNDPAPGPFKKTFAQGFLWIVPQNDPTA